jgi:hypothetical protein
MNTITTKNKSFLQFSLFSLLIIFSINSFALDRFVKQGGSGTQTGLSWDNAMPSIGAAITAANAAAPTINNVYVAKGLYALTATMTIPNVNVNIQGGFPDNLTGTTISGYSPSTNETVVNFSQDQEGIFIVMTLLLKDLLF